MLHMYTHYLITPVVGYGVLGCYYKSVYVHFSDVVGNLDVDTLRLVEDCLNPDTHKQIKLIQIKLVICQKMKSDLIKCVCSQKFVCKYFKCLLFS
jgi:hypothetical protein